MSPFWFPRRISLTWRGPSASMFPAKYQLGRRWFAGARFELRSGHQRKPAGHRRFSGSNLLVELSLARFPAGRRAYQLRTRNLTSNELLFQIQFSMGALRAHLVLRNRFSLKRLFALLIVLAAAATSNAASKLNVIGPRKTWRLARSGRRPCQRRLDCQGLPRPTLSS